jgi:5-formyltetrahydrofolate cyclo-ligase
MTESIREKKAAVRREVGGRLKAMSEAARRESSVRACALLLAQPEWQAAASVLLYAPMAGELDVWPVVEAALAAGKVVGLPRFVAAAGRYEVREVRDLTRDIVAGHYGIREPGAHCEVLNRLDFILVPGVGFDRRGCRLGRGKGYYDQLLATVSGATCGVAFEEQMVPEVPVEPHDRHLDCILTPSRWLKFRPGSVLE